MASQVNATVDCRLIDEFVDEAEIPAGVAVGRSEAVRPNLVASYVDQWQSDDLKEFTVLLKDGRVVAVRGHGLKHEPHPVVGQDVFGVVVRTATDEVLVAAFKSAEITGIFHGDLRSDRSVA